MKSKSLGHTSVETLKQNRSFDFVNLYKSASENNSSFGAKPQTNDADTTTSHKVMSESPKREKSPNKRKKFEKRESIDISHITIDGPGMNSSSVGRSTPINESKVTSTPLVNRKLQHNSGKVKSIMKSSPIVRDDAMDGSIIDTSSSKPKKRNKSVSFMLGDAEEVVNKKTKSNETTNKHKGDTISKVKPKKHFKKAKRDQSAEKENKIDVNQQTVVAEDSVNDKTQKKSKSKHEKSNTIHATPDNIAGDIQTENIEIKKKRKRAKKFKKTDETTESNENIGTENTNQEVPDKTKKPKKKKHQEKPELENEEPASKSRKRDSKPDVVAELENLSIGDNTHTLTNMLDEMTVVDKDNRKKLKRKLNKNKKAKGAKVEDKVEDFEKTEDVQEKVKWSRRKWNKDCKADANETSWDTTVIVENLPLSMLFSYKKVLAEHFAKYGLIKSVGIMEVYPTEVSKPVFTTTVNFHSSEAATQALQDDAVLEGSRAQVRRAPPPTATTLVVRSYGPLDAQAVSSMFNGAGRIRNIRHLVKGKHSMATFFVELDGPKSVERAMKLATDAKVGGKKVYVSQFEIRTKKTKQKAKDNDGSDADQSEDSQG